MPQETKARPYDPEELEHAPGFMHENLQGWIPSLASDEEVRDALEKAFDYRGDVTITLKDGQKIAGYVFDRRSDAPSLAECRVRIIPSESSEKISIRYSEIARLQFSGKDT